MERWGARARDGALAKIRAGRRIRRAELGHGLTSLRGVRHCRRVVTRYQRRRLRPQREEVAHPSVRRAGWRPNRKMHSLGHPLVLPLDPQLHRGGIQAHAAQHTMVIHLVRDAARIGEWCTNDDMVVYPQVIDRGSHSHG